MLSFITFFFFFNKLKVGDSPVLSKYTGIISQPLLTLCHILVILTVFLIFLVMLFATMFCDQ